MNAETALALGALLSGGWLYEAFLQENYLKPFLLSYLSDWYYYEPRAANQFDCTKVRQSVKAASESELMRLITQMGFRAEPDKIGPDVVYTFRDNQWERYMDHYIAEREKERGQCTETAYPSSDTPMNE